MSQFNFGPAKVQIEDIKGVANGIASLNSSGKVPNTQLPTELPAVTSSDNGKVLRVVDGAWAASSIPSATGVSF